MKTQSQGSLCGERGRGGIKPLTRREEGERSEDQKSERLEAYAQRWGIIRDRWGMSLRGGYKDEGRTGLYFQNGGGEGVLRRGKRKSDTLSSQLSRTSNKLWAKTCAHDRLIVEVEHKSR